MIRHYLTALIIATLLALAGLAPAGARDLTLPDPKVTPGATVEISLAGLCSKKWGKDVRHVDGKMKAAAFANYHLKGNDDPACVPDAHGRRCEIDHCVSRELGGADLVANLWPQPYGTAPWNAGAKDRVENRLHREVCAGRIDLKVAQQEVCGDYTVPYRRYFGEPGAKKAKAKPKPKKKRRP